MGEMVKVAEATDLPAGKGMQVTVGGQPVALFNVDGEFFAVDNLCPHQGGPLGEGMVENDSVICPWHAWAFNVKTGESPLNPRAKIDTFPVTIEGDDIYITM